VTNSLNHTVEILQDRFGLKVASRLSAGSSDLPHDISERLRAARVRAVAQRKTAVLQAARSIQNHGGVASLSFSDEAFGGWRRFASVMPLIALVAGLITINYVQTDSRAREVAEVDSALLADELPPSAFADPGFVQFLSTGSDSAQNP
jgi:hypothetical protein